MYFLNCSDCGASYHASEGGCSCGGERLFCDSCDDFIGTEDDSDFQKRGELRLCKYCADEYDNTCVECGIVDSGVGPCPIESTDDSPYLVCPVCSDRIKEDTAKELRDRQRHYEELHFKMNIEYFESLDKLDSFQRRILARARYCLKNPEKETNAVDLDDSEYIAELDEWESIKK